MLCIALISLILNLSVSNSDGQNKEFSIQGYAQGTSYLVKYTAEESLLMKGSVDSIISRIDSSMSLYKSYSLINQFNRSEKGIPVDEHFLKVVQKAFEISKDTDGRFDITVGPLVNAWGFGSSAASEFPDSAKVGSLLRCVGMENLTLNRNFLSKQIPCVQVDLNGIAQGYTVDLISEHLLSLGINNFLIEIGGEVRASGSKLNGDPFVVGIEGPANDKETSIKYLVSLGTGAITTSGNYSKVRQSGNVRASHLVDPHTGYPIQGQMISVTVYTKDAITADGYDNALMAMDIVQAKKYVEARDFLEAYFIYRKKDGSIADLYTDGFKKLLVSPLN